ncbi:hypothetical protein BDV12DRAFT_160198 [Aspergillus spectabilis]
MSWLFDYVVPAAIYGVRHYTVKVSRWMLAVRFPVRWRVCTRLLWWLVLPVTALPGVCLDPLPEGLWIVDVGLCVCYACCGHDTVIMEVLIYISYGLRLEGIRDKKSLMKSR